MSIEFILGIVGAVVMAIAAAFGIGHSKGKSKAEQKAVERETEIKLEAEKAVANRQTTTAKEASDVKDTVSRMSGSAVDDELRSEWLNNS
ncbi:hypothetical protein ACO0E4_001487 [Cronobacter sakazakii]